mgnify:CR=1 FL=1
MGDACIPGRRSGGAGRAESCMSKRSGLAPPPHVTLSPAWLPLSPQPAPSTHHSPIAQATARTAPPPALTWT